MSVTARNLPPVLLAPDASLPRQQRSRVRYLVRGPVIAWLSRAKPSLADIRSDYGGEEHHHHYCRAISNDRDLYQEISTDWTPGSFLEVWGSDSDSLGSVPSNAGDFDCCHWQSRWAVESRFRHTINNKVIAAFCFTIMTFFLHFTCPNCERNSWLTFLFIYFYNFVVETKAELLDVNSSKKKKKRWDVKNSGGIKSELWDVKGEFVK